MIDPRAVDYHIALAQLLCRSALSRVELRDELFIQLVKQTTKQPYPNSAMTYQTWQLMAILCGVFIPVRPIIQQYVTAHLRRFAPLDGAVGRYAAYTLRVLDHELRVDPAVLGPRTLPPSRTEILAIMKLETLAQATSTPLQIDVFLPSGASVSVELAVCDPVHFLLDRATRSAAMSHRVTKASQFAVFANDGAHADISVRLMPSERLTDVLSRFDVEKRTTNMNDGSGKDAARRHASSLRFTVQQWQFLPESGAFAPALQRARAVNCLPLDMVDIQDVGPASSWFSPEKATVFERVMLFSLANDAIVHKRIPVTQRAAAALAALQAQAEFGDYREGSETVIHAVQRYCPEDLVVDDISVATDGAAGPLTQAVQTKWAALKGTAAATCITAYLHAMRNAPLFGATLFAVEPLSPSSELPSKMFLAISHDGLAVVNSDMMITAVFKWKNIVSFADSADSTFAIFIDMAPLSQTAQKMIFKTPRVRVVFTRFWSILTFTHSRDNCRRLCMHTSTQLSSPKWIPRLSLQFMWPISEPRA